MSHFLLLLLSLPLWMYAGDKVIPSKAPAQNLGLQMMGTDFQANVKWTKKENVNTNRSCGLQLKDRSRGGSILSPAFELNGADKISTFWDSDVPNERMVVSIRTARQKNEWGDWIVVNEQPKVGAKTTDGKTVEGITGSKYLQYSIELQAPTQDAPGCFRMIGFLGISDALVNSLKQKSGK